MIIIIIIIIIINNNNPQPRQHDMKAIIMLTMKIGSVVFCQLCGVSPRRKFQVAFCFLSQDMNEEGLLSCQPKVTVTYILFSIARYNTIVYASLELTRIEISHVY